MDPMSLGIVESIGSSILVSLKDPCLVALNTLLGFLKEDLYSMTNHSDPNVCES